MHTSLSFTCPHCYEANEAFGPQRCEHCGLSMISDRDLKIRDEKIGPMVDKLDEILLFIRTGKDMKSSIPYARTLYEQLAPYEENPSFSFLTPLLDEAREQIPPAPPAPAKRDTTLIFNIVILLILIATPLLFAGMETHPVVLGLLLLPVLGWFYIGIYAYLKRKK